MRSLIVLTILSLIAFSFCVEEEEFPIENDITVLTEANFDKAIAKYEHILVMFYAPWCGHCKKFKPELEKAAAILRKENLIVGQKKIRSTNQNIKNYRRFRKIQKRKPSMYYILRNKC